MAERLVVYRESGKRRRFRWKHIAANNKIDNASEQGYRTRWYAKRKARRAYPSMEVT